MTTEHPGQDPATDLDAAPPRRRRTVVLAGALVAVLLVAAVVTWLALRGTDPASGGDAPGGTTTESPSGDGTTDPSATGSATATPDGATSTTASPSQSATEGPSPTPTAAATTLPADLTLPAEGQEGWTAAGWSYQPCGTQVSASGASGFRRVVADGQESSGSQSLLTFPTEEAATAFLATMRTAAEACAGPGDPGADVPAVVVGTLDGDWDDSLTVVQSYPVPEGGYGTGGDYTLAVRTGTAVAVSGGYAEWPPGYPTPDPGAVAEYRKALDVLAPDLCVFTAEGC
jgi:hypothetical protein